MVPASPMDVEECALALIKAYDQLRRRIDPTFTSASRQYRTFETAAERLLAGGGGDPYEYVGYVFQCFTGRIPHCGYLASVKFIGAFVNDRPVRLKELKLFVELQLDDVKFRMGHGENLEKILTDPFAGFSPVLCWAMATTAMDGALAKRFEKEAMVQLKFEPAYGELLKGWLPQDAVERARAGGVERG